MPSQRKQNRKVAASDVNVDMTDVIIAPANAPKTADEAIKGLREHQVTVSKAARAASTIFADIQAAKGSGMTQEAGRELENEFNNATAKTADALKALNQFKELVKEVATKEKVAKGAKIGDLAKTNSLARLSFPPNDYDRAKHVAAFEAGEVTIEDFKAEALSALFRATMALAGAAPASAEAVKISFTDPTVTMSGGAFEAAAAVTTTSGGSVFVAGSELEQTHRAVGEELSSDLAAVASAESGLAAALAAAAANENEGKGKGKAMPVRRRAAGRSAAPPAPRADDDGGDGGKKKGKGKGKSKEADEDDDDDDDEKKGGEKEKKEKTKKAAAKKDEKEKKPPGGGGGGGGGGSGGPGGAAGAASGAGGGGGKSKSKGYEYQWAPRVRPFRGDINFDLD